MFKLFVGIILFAATLFYGNDFESNYLNNETKIEQPGEGIR